MRATAVALLLLAGCAAPQGGGACPPTDLAGTVGRVEANSFVLEASDGWNGTVLVRFGEATRWWDIHGDGCRPGEAGLREGDQVRTDGAQAMTRSLPPQATARNVLRLP